MVDKHPYISGTGGIVKAMQHFRSSLPGSIDAGVIKKLGIAPKNESYLINILRFLKMIDEKGVPTAEARGTFTQHDDSAFAKKLSEMIKKAYADLFSLHSDKTWTLGTDDLITYFRQSDQSSAVVGGRQASTFQALAAFAGHGEVPIARPAASPKSKPAGPSARRKGTTGTREILATDTGQVRNADLGLTVRIEINLPAVGDQDTYNRIFKSIRENLLNG